MSNTWATPLAQTPLERGHTIALAVDGEHESLKGHFPDQPILPGIFALQALIDGLRGTGQLRGGDKLHVTSIRFRAPLLPGDTLTLDYTPTTDTRARQFNAIGHNQLGDEVLRIKLKVRND